MKYRHVVNVMRPTKSLDARGQLQGKDETVVKDWPCSIETLSGNKAQTERMVVPNATHRVEGWGDPSRPLMEKDYLVLGDRKFEIELINDAKFNGIQLTLICSETKLG